MNRSASCGPWRRPRRRPRKKNGRSDPPGSRARSRPTVARHLQRRRKTGRLDLEAIEMAVRSAMHQAGAAALTELLQFPAPGRRPADHPLFLRPPGSLPGTALQAGPDRGGQGGSIAPLLLVPALSYRPIPRRCRTGHRKHGVLSGRAPHAGGGGPGGALRSRPPADETAGRSGGDHQSRGADGGSHRRGYRRARAGGDPAGRAVGSADGRRASRFRSCMCKWTGRECPW